MARIESTGPIIPIFWSCENCSLMGKTGVYLSDWAMMLSYFICPSCSHVTFQSTGRGEVFNGERKDDTDDDNGSEGKYGVPV